MSLRLVITRHTETNDNLYGIISGQQDVSLNTTGEAQADALATRIAALTDIVAILSSDLSRTKYLADRLGEATGVAPLFTKNLRELDVGTMSGLRKSDAQKKFPDAKFAFDENRYFDLRELEGESHQDLLERFDAVAGTVATIARPYSRREVRIILVSHGTFLSRVFVHEHRCIRALHAQGYFQEFSWPTL